MSNNLSYQIPATGVPVSTQESTIDSVVQHLQRVKVGVGTKGNYQEDLSYGQNTKANSIPVTVSSDQILPINAPLGEVTGTGTALDATPIASTSTINYRSVSIQLSTAGNTCIFEGSNDGTNWFPIVLNNISTNSPMSQTLLNGIYSGPICVKNFRVRISAYTSGTVSATAEFSAVEASIYGGMNKKDTYLATTPNVSMSTTINAETSIAYLWHPNSNTKKISLQKILVSYLNSIDGSGDYRLVATRITAENGTPGGTTSTIVKQDADQASSNCTFRYGANAPTRQTGDAISIIIPGDSTGQAELVGILESKGFTCRPSQNEGWELRAIAGSGLSPSPKFNTTFVWTEE